MIWVLLDPHPTHLHFLGEGPGLRASSAEEERVLRAHGGVWALWESTGGWRSASATNSIIPHPRHLPALSLPQSWTQNEGHGFHKSGGLVTLGAQQVLRIAREGPGTGHPPHSGRSMTKVGPPLLAPT